MSNYLTSSTYRWSWGSSWNSVVILLMGGWEERNSFWIFPSRISFCFRCQILLIILFWLVHFRDFRYYICVLRIMLLREAFEELKNSSEKEGGKNIERRIRRKETENYLNWIKLTLIFFNMKIIPSFLFSPRLFIYQFEYGLASKCMNSLANASRIYEIIWTLSQTTLIEITLTPVHLHSVYLF